MLCKLYPPAFCCSFLHLHLPPFFPNPLSFHFPSAIGILIWERRTDTERISMGMQGHVVERILSTYGCLTQSPVQTPVCMHTHRGVYRHISHVSMHTYTQTHSLLGIISPLGTGWIECICTSGLNSEDYGGYEGNAKAGREADDLGMELEGSRCSRLWVAYHSKLQ